MSWFINSLGLVLGVGLACFLLALLVGSCMYYANEKCGDELNGSYKVYQEGKRNINIGGNCSVVQTNGTTIIKNDDYTIIVTKDGISVNGKKIDLNKEETE